MVGVGVLTSNGYMARSLPAAAILAIWLIQGLLALAGARTYAALAVLRPTSGGEYRYLSDLLHPSLGVFAGWTSLVVGFAAPVAANAFAAAAFLRALVPSLPVQLTAPSLVALFTLAALARLGLAKGAQDALVIAKLLLLSAFVAVGLSRGHHGWAESGRVATGAAEQGLSGAAHPAPLAAFVVNLFYAAYAYSGWNAAAYAAGAFRDPARTVPRAMGLAAAIVTVFYVAMAYVFVSNLDANDLGQWTEARVTMAHLLVAKLAGPRAAALASLGIVLVLGSCISAMMLTGPRVTGAMARDGFLPRWLAGSDVHPRATAVLLQGGLALVLLLTSSFEKLMAGVGVALTASSALCALAFLRSPRPDVPSLAAWTARAAALVYFVGASAEVVMALWLFPQAVLWLATLSVLTLAGYRGAIAVKARRTPV
jgi:APA family basic amino acid/polyamine antiporter